MDECVSATHDDENHPDYSLKVLNLSTFYARIFRQYFFTKKFQTQNVSREKLRKALSYEKFAIKMLMKLTEGVDFSNILFAAKLLCAAFLIKQFVCIILRNCLKFFGKIGSMWKFHYEQLCWMKKFWIASLSLHYLFAIFCCKEIFKKLCIKCWQNCLKYSIYKHFISCFFKQKCFAQLLLSYILCL